MSAAQQAVSLFDDRPFFEKALAHGVRHGLIGQDKLDAICAEAPKGMVQIARYFGTEIAGDLHHAFGRFGTNGIEFVLSDQAVAHTVGQCLFEKWAIVKKRNSLLCG